MKFSDLKITKNKSSIRAGRGISAGRGKTAGRGTKGQGSRKSGGVRPGFEGGQMPLYMRLPKLRGFTSHRPKAHNIKTSELDELKLKKVDNFVLTEKGLVPHPFSKVKLIADKDIKTAVEVKLQGASTSAKAIVEKAGGTFVQIPQNPRPKTSKKS
ncbi:MAG: 50S ribosomal protein L15 [Patescibacteria group bacterium]